MSADHKRPLYAFVIVAVMCAVIIANTLRSEAVMGFLADRATGLVHGVTLSHEQARDGALRADAATSPSATPAAETESFEPVAGRSTSQPAAPASHARAAGQHAASGAGGHISTSAPPEVVHPVVHQTVHPVGPQAVHQAVAQAARQVSRGLVHKVVQQVVQQAVRRALRDVVLRVGHATGRHGRGHAAADLLRPVAATEQQVVHVAARSVAALLETSRSAATDLVRAQLADLSRPGDHQSGPGLALGRVLGSDSGPDQQASDVPPAGGSEKP